MPRKVVYEWFGDSWCVTIKNNKTLLIYSVILMPSLLLPATLDSNCKCRLFHDCVHHEMIYCISQYSCRGPKLYELPEVKLGVDLSKWLMNNYTMFKPLKTTSRYWALFVSEGHLRVWMGESKTRVPYFYQLCYWQHFKCPPFLKSYFTLLHANVFTSQTPTFPTIKPIKIYTFRTLRSRSYEKPRNTASESFRYKLTTAFTTPSLTAIVCAGAFSEERQFEITGIGHLQHAEVL